VISDEITTAREFNRIKVRQVEAAIKPGRYPDGRLYLAIGRNQAKSWVYRYLSPTHRVMRRSKEHGKIREMGPETASGPLAISLAQA
jgi:hypothetical protein